MQNRLTTLIQGFWNDLDLSKFSFRSGLYLIGIIALIIIGRNFHYPHLFYWDESYHIASAQKYLHGIFFLENHPPFGKIMIAAGEALLAVNPRSDQFISVELAKLLDGFSMQGYRLFPIIFSLLAALLFYELIYLIIKNVERSIIFTLFFLLDNAIVVHLRGAMLEGIQICFILATCVSACKLIAPENGEKRYIYALQMGACFALSVMTKITSLFLLAAAPILFLFIFRTKVKVYRTACYSIASFIVVSCLVFYLHFALLKNVNTALPAEGLFNISANASDIITKGDGAKISNLPLLIWEYGSFIGRYNKGVPTLNLCKEDESGSPPYFWPIGARSIKYLTYPFDDKVAYLYLQGNPVIWLLSLIGIIGGVSILMCKIFFWESINIKYEKLIFSLVYLYFAYMIPMLLIGRVMYLYHYLIALLIGIILFITIFESLSKIGPFNISKEGREYSTYTLALLFLLGFIYYGPLTYFSPLTAEQVNKRNLIPIWDLRCQDCPRRGNLANPIKALSNVDNSSEAASTTSHQSTSTH